MVYDAIGAAQTAAELDDLVKHIWSRWGAGDIDDADAACLEKYARQRRPISARGPAARIIDKPAPRVSVAAPNLRPVGSIKIRSRFPRRPEQRSPDKQASCDRRHRLAYSGVLPRHLAPKLTIGDMAVMRVIADEYMRAGACEMSLKEIAARAGACRKTAQRALQKARDERLLSIEERPVPKQRHRTNIIRLISLEWLKWLRRSKDEATERPSGGLSHGPQTLGGGGHFVPATNTKKEDDGYGSGDGAVVDFRKSESPPEAVRPQVGRLSSEAIAFADELALIAGYTSATTPECWRNADPPRIVQVWLNELRKYDLGAPPIEVVRKVVQLVMSRRQGVRSSPLYSPRYFSVEIFRIIDGLEAAMQELREMRRSA